MTTPSDASAEFYKLILFIADDGPNSVKARANLKNICNTYLQGRCNIQIIDVLEAHQTAQDYGILVTPALVKVEPPPKAMVVGNLDDTDKVLRAMGITDIG